MPCWECVHQKHLGIEVWYITSTHGHLHDQKVQQESAINLPESPWWWSVHEAHCLQVTLVLCLYLECLSLNLQIFYWKTYTNTCFKNSTHIHSYIQTYAQKDCLLCWDKKRRERERDREGGKRKGRTKRMKVQAKREQKGWIITEFLLPIEYNQKAPYTCMHN